MGLALPHAKDPGSRNHSDSKRRGRINVRIEAAGREIKSSPSGTNVHGSSSEAPSSDQWEDSDSESDSEQISQDDESDRSENDDTERGWLASCTKDSEPGIVSDQYFW